MTTAQKEALLAIERSLWTEGSDAYRQHVDDVCLVAFTKMAGLSSREEIAASVEDGPRWQNVQMDLEGAHQPTGDMAILTYRASADRGDESYRALISSAYVKRHDGWKLSFHQQTPLEEIATKD